MKTLFHLQRIVCFGDGDNDVAMLKMADLGIAMGNAQKACKESADCVIGSIQEDGIYHYLRRMKKCAMY